MTRIDSAAGTTGGAGVDVCIATYRRPALLARLLESLAAQDTGGGVEWRVVVVDNDAAGSAGEVAARFGGRLPLVYDVEPTPNIARARNRALTHARGEFIATIDDDCVAAPDWLRQLVAAAHRYEADAVLGAVERVLPAGAPTWLRDSHVFDFPDPPSGSREHFVDNTANALFRRAMVVGVAEPFDPSFGRTGGEDTKFFHELRLRGARIVWERTARVRELVLPERVSIRWIAQRSFREGATSYRVRRSWYIAASAPTLARWAHLSLWTMKMSGRILAGGVLRPGRRASAVRDVHELAFNLGIAAAALGVRGRDHYGASTR